MIVLVIYVVSDVVFCNCVMSSYLQGNEILHLIFSTIKNTVNYDLKDYGYDC